MSKRKQEEDGKQVGKKRRRLDEDRVEEGNGLVGVGVGVGSSTPSLSPSSSPLSSHTPTESKVVVDDLRAEIDQLDARVAALERKKRTAEESRDAGHGIICWWCSFRFAPSSPDDHKVGFVPTLCIPCFDAADDKSKRGWCTVCHVLLRHNDQDLCGCCLANAE
jgi:hypothetical protein